MQFWNTLDSTWVCSTLGRGQSENFGDTDVVAQRIRQRTRTADPKRRTRLPWERMFCQTILWNRNTVGVQLAREPPVRVQSNGHNLELTLPSSHDVTGLSNPPRTCGASASSENFSITVWESSSKEVPNCNSTEMKCYRQ